MTPVRHILIACSLVVMVALPAESQTRVTRPEARVTLVTRSFSAPAQLVIAAFTEARHLLRWMAADGMTLVASDIDLRQGGSLRHVFERPNGRRLEVRGAIVDVDLPRRFAYTESYDFSPLHIDVVMQFEAVADRTTVVRQTSTYGSNAERDADFESASTSAVEAFLRLDRYLATLR